MTSHSTDSFDNPDLPQLQAIKAHLVFSVLYPYEGG